MEYISHNWFVLRKVLKRILGKLDISTIFSLNYEFWDKIRFFKNLFKDKNLDDNNSKSELTKQQ